MPPGIRLRLALYRKMWTIISAVDTGEAVALNMGYAMLSEMLGAAGKPLPDDQIMALLRQAIRRASP